MRTSGGNIYLTDAEKAFVEDFAVISEYAGLGHNGHDYSKNDIIEKAKGSLIKSLGVKNAEEARKIDPDFDKKAAFVYMRANEDMIADAGRGARKNGDKFDITAGKIDGYIREFGDIVFSETAATPKKLIAFNKDGTVDRENSDLIKVYTLMDYVSASGSFKHKMHEKDRYFRKRIANFAEVIRNGANKLYNEKGREEYKNASYYMPESSELNEDTCDDIRKRLAYMYRARKVIGNVREDVEFNYTGLTRGKRAIVYTFVASGVVGVAGLLLKTVAARNVTVDKENHSAQSDGSFIGNMTAGIANFFDGTVGAWFRGLSDKKLNNESQDIADEQSGNGGDTKNISRDSTVFSGVNCIFDESAITQIKFDNDTEFNAKMQSLFGEVAAEDMAADLEIATVVEKKHTAPSMLIKLGDKAYIIHDVVDNDLKSIIESVNSSELNEETYSSFDGMASKIYDAVTVAKYSIDEIKVGDSASLSEIVDNANAGKTGNRATFSNYTQCNDIVVDYLCGQGNLGVTVDAGAVREAFESVASDVTGIEDATLLGAKIEKVDGSSTEVIYYTHSNSDNSYRATPVMLDATVDYNDIKDIDTTSIGGLLDVISLEGKKGESTEISDIQPLYAEGENGEKSVLSGDVFSFLYGGIKYGKDNADLLNYTRSHYNEETGEIISDEQEAPVPVDEANETQADTDTQTPDATAETQAQGTTTVTEQ